MNTVPTSTDRPASEVDPIDADRIVRGASSVDSAANDSPAAGPLPPGSLRIDFFDGRTTRARRGTARIEGESLWLQGDALDLRLPLRDVRWPERTRHGARLAHLRGGGSFQALDASEWDAWARDAGLAESPVVRAQQSWRRTGVAVLGLAIFAFAAYRWGVPLLSGAILRALPVSVDRRVGDAALGSFDGVFLLPSRVPAARQDAIRRQFDHVVDRYPDDRGVKYRLLFRTSPAVGPRKDDATARRTQIGANAFALPGGAIVVTDDMLALLEGRDDVLMGVLGHELGHVRHRHGMRMVVQSTVFGGMLAMVWGDVSTVLTAAPAVLGQSAYSRDFERQADEEAIDILRANRVSPEVMVELFDRLAASRPAVDNDDKPGGFDLGIALANHPPDAERIARFHAAAGH